MTLEPTDDQQTFEEKKNILMKHELFGAETSKPEEQFT
jgi:hypothetical protein